VFDMPSPLSPGLPVVLDGQLCMAQMTVTACAPINAGECLLVKWHNVSLLAAMARGHNFSFQEFCHPHRE
jgi:hypothetical protein